MTAQRTAHRLVAEAVRDGRLRPVLSLQCVDCGRAHHEERAYGRRISSEAAPIAASPRGGRGRRRDTPLLPAVALASLPGCAADADAIIVAAAVLAPLWVLGAARRLRRRWAAEDAARAATSRAFGEANRKLADSIEKFQASIERARGRA